MHLADVLVSLSGVALIVAMVWWAMGSALAGIGDERSVRERIGAEHPDLAVGRLGLDADGHSALAISADDREAALLFTLGKRVVCWRLPRARLRARLLHLQTRPRWSSTPGTSRVRPCASCSPTRGWRKPSSPIYKATRAKARPRESS
jgi:hypothetical protein